MDERQALKDLNFDSTKEAGQSDNENVAVLKESSNHDEGNKENITTVKDNKPFDDQVYHNKPRRSVLEYFDPLFSNSSPKTPTLKKPQLIIECSSGEENNGTALSDAEISDENEGYQDANNENNAENVTNLLSITVTQEVQEIGKVAEEDSIHEKFYSLTFDDSQQVDLSKSDVESSSNVKNLNNSESATVVQGAENNCIEENKASEIMLDSLEIDSLKDLNLKSQNASIIINDESLIDPKERLMENKEFCLSRQRDSGIVDDTNQSIFAENKNIGDKDCLNDAFSPVPTEVLSNVMEHVIPEQSNEKIDDMMDSLELSQIGVNCKDHTLDNENNISLVAETINTEDTSRENSLNELNKTSQSECNQNTVAIKKEVGKHFNNDSKDHGIIILSSTHESRETNNGKFVIADSIKKTDIIGEENSKHSVENTVEPNITKSTEVINENQINQEKYESNLNNASDTQLNTNIDHNIKQDLGNTDTKNVCEENITINESVKSPNSSICANSNTTGIKKESKLTKIITEEDITEKVIGTVEETLTAQNKSISLHTDETLSQVGNESYNFTIFNKLDMSLKEINLSKDHISNIECLNQNLVMKDDKLNPNNLNLQNRSNDLNQQDDECVCVCKVNNLTEDTEKVLMKQETDIKNLKEKNKELAKSAEVAIKKCQDYENELLQVNEKLITLSTEKDNEIVNLKKEITNAVSLAKNELQKEYEDKILQLQNENKKLQTMLDEHQLKSNQSNLAEEENAVLKEQKLYNEMSFQGIIAQYEKSMENMMQDHQKLKEEYKLATSHLATLEMAFSDLNQRYERSKSVILGYKENEEIMLKNTKMLEESLSQQKSKYEALKEHAKTQIERSNKQILTAREQHQSEYNKLNAFVKRLEIKCASLESALAQKTQECAALSELCDEVTRK